MDDPTATGQSREKSISVELAAEFMSGDLTEFERDASTVLISLGPGEVTTYGEVAEDAGHPGAARAVGSLLRRAPAGVFPWWRVVNATGRMFPGAVGRQAELLRDEGVAVDGDPPRMLGRPRSHVRELL